MQLQDYHQFSKLDHERRLPLEGDGTDVGLIREFVKAHNQGEWQDR